MNTESGGEWKIFLYLKVLSELLAGLIGNGGRLFSSTLISHGRLIYLLGGWNMAAGRQPTKDVSIHGKFLFA